MVVGFGKFSWMSLSKRVGEATVGVAAVGALPLGFQVKLGLVRGKILPAGLHAAEASYVSSSSMSAFRAAIVRAVWSTKMPLADTPAILNLLERCLGAYPVDFAGAWTPPEYWDAADVALEMTQHPDIWTDGSREDFSSIGGFEVAGAGVYLHASELAFDGLVWGTAEEYGDARLERCHAFLPVPGVMQTVQRAEFWGPIVALQANWPCHLGIDNLNVARSIGRLLDFDCLTKPLLLVKDGDLIALVQYMIRTRLRETVRVTKVMEHAKDVDVQQGRVRLVDQHGNAEADAAADLGRRHQSEALIDARRRLLQALCHWYPIMIDLHRFMIAVARVSVNHDGKGGTAPDPLVWDQGSRPKVRKLWSTWFSEEFLDSC